MCVRATNNDSMGTTQSNFRSQPTPIQRADPFKYFDPVASTQLPTVNPKAYVPAWVREGRSQAVLYNSSTDIRGDLDELVGGTTPFSNANPRAHGALQDKRENARKKVGHSKFIPYRSFTNEVGIYNSMR